MDKGELTKQYFIAAFPPDHAVKNIKTLADKGPDEWEWKRRADYHISLAFPGRLTDEEAKKLIETLKGVNHKAFDVSFDGISFHLKDPVKQKTRNHVLWARPDHNADNEFRDLITKIADELRKKKFRHGIQNVSPHLTVARPPPEAGDLTKEFAKANGNLKEASWKMDKFYLCETLSPSDPDHPGKNNGQGSRYKKIASFTLS